MKCHIHSEVDSVETCVSCGSPICSDCMVAIDDRGYCKKCSQDLTVALKSKKKEGDIEVSEEEIKEGKIWAVMAYLGILCLFPLLIKKDNRFVLFHAKQGLVIFLFAIATGWIPILGLLTILILFIIGIIGIVQALLGNCWKIPGIGHLADKIKI